MQGKAEIIGVDPMMGSPDNSCYGIGMASSEVVYQKIAQFLN